MPATVNLNINGFSDTGSALRALQAYLGQPVSTNPDPQTFGPAIIALQTFLSTQAAGGQPSGFKFDPAKIRKSVADYDMRGLLIELQKSADLT